MAKAVDRTSGFAAWLKDVPLRDTDPRLTHVNELLSLPLLESETPPLMIF